MTQQDSVNWRVDDSSQGGNHHPSTKGGKPGKKWSCGPEIQKKYDTVDLDCILLAVVFLSFKYYFKNCLKHFFKYCCSVHFPTPLCSSHRVPAGFPVFQALPCTVLLAPAPLLISRSFLFVHLVFTWFLRLKCSYIFGFS